MKRITYRPNYQYALETANSLAQMYVQEELPDKAEASFQDTIKLVEEQPNAPDGNLQMALSNLGNFYLSRSNYVPAEPVLNRLARSQEKSLGTDNSVTLKTLSELAFVYDRNGKPAEAETAYKKVLAAKKKSKDPASEEILVSTGELAAFYVRHDRYEPAALLYEEL